MVPILITNKHVVQSLGPGSFSLAAREGSFDQPKIGERVDFSHPDFQTLWTGHTNPAIDLSAAFLGPFLHSAEMQGKPTFIRAVTEDICPTDVLLEDLDAAESVAFVGYPNALYDKVNLTPIIRRGYTATPVSLDYNGLPAFLIDASVFPGSSGSPVFIYQENYKQGNQIMMGMNRLLFVGVVAAVHLQKDRGQILTGSVPRMEFNQMLDLGIVFNWRAVIGTVENLFEVNGLTYGEETPAIGQDQPAIEITTQDKPPERPDPS
jgi:hypothetical protein